MQKYAPICPRVTRGIVNVDPSTLATFWIEPNEKAHDQIQNTCKYMKRERSKIQINQST